MQKTTRRWVGGAIVVFWLVMMAWLWQREMGGRRLEPSTLAAAPTVANTWLGVFLGDGPQVGHIHVSQLPETRHDLSGQRWTMNARLKLDLMGKETDLGLLGVMWQPETRERAEFDFSVRSMGNDLRLTGELADGMLHGTVESAGESLPLEIAVGQELLLQSGLGSALRFPNLEVGDDVRIDSFDPLTMSRSPARVRCLAIEPLTVAGETVEARVLEVSTGGIKSKAWVDATGEVLRAETPFGLTLQKITRADALRRDDVTGDATEGFLGLTAVRPSGPRPTRGMASLTVRLSGLDERSGLGERQLPVDQVQQQIEPGTFRLTRPAEPTGRELDSAMVEQHLASDAFVQSDHPAITERAAAIVGDQDEPWQQALLLHEWVYTALEKVPVVSVPSALEVLQQRRGDCNEHAVLFTALARATGLPTRIAIGLVWSDELDGFYYHAWPEVHIGGGWLWMDPTLDQPLADATHLKLLNGGIESWPQLLPFLGQLQIEILEDP